MSPPKAVAKILVALANLAAQGEDRLEKERVGNHAGVPFKTSTMRNACAYLKKECLADTSDSKSLKLTQKGHDLALTLDGVVELPTSNEEFHNRFKEEMKNMTGGNKAIEIFDELLEGRPLTKSEIAQAIGVEQTKSTFRNAMAPLNKLKLMDKDASGKYFLTGKCFPVTPRS